MVQIPYIWWVKTLVNHTVWFILIISSHKFCVWKGNSYKCIFNEVKCKNNCPRLFGTNSSLRFFSKSWQYYFNAKGRFALTQVNLVVKTIIISDLKLVLPDYLLSVLGYCYSSDKPEKKERAASGLTELINSIKRLWLRCIVKQCVRRIWVDLIL